MKIKFANKIFILQTDGTLYWPKMKVLIAADLHLEKSSFYAFHKVSNLPPYDSIDTISRLKKKIKQLNVKSLILLGDIFHDKDGYKRMKNNTKKILQDICNEYLVIWIIGNHDGILAPANTLVYEDYLIENIKFTHISSSGALFEISGHYHPKATFKYKGKKIAKPTFLVSTNKIILPAYGTYTGGLSINSQVFKKVFKTDYRAFVTSNNKVFVVE